MSSAGNEEKMLGKLGDYRTYSVYHILNVFPLTCHGEIVLISPRITCEALKI